MAERKEMPSWLSSLCNYAEGVASLFTWLNFGIFERRVHYTKTVTKSSHKLSDEAAKGIEGDLERLQKDMDRVYADMKRAMDRIDKETKQP